MSKIEGQYPEPQPAVRARDIFAKAFVIGANGTATSTEYGVNSTQVLDAFVKLRSGVASLGLSEPQQRAVDKELQGLDRAVRAAPPDATTGGLHLKAVVDKLEMAGVFVSNIAALAEPARKIAEAVGLLPGMLGL